MNDPLEALSGYVQGLRDENTRLRGECGQLRGLFDVLRIDMATLNGTIAKLLALVGGQPAAAEPEPAVYVLPLAAAETTVASAEFAIEEPASPAPHWSKCRSGPRQRELLSRLTAACTAGAAAYCWISVGARGGRISSVTTAARRCTGSAAGWSWPPRWYWRCGARRA